MGEFPLDTQFNIAYIGLDGADRIVLPILLRRINPLEVQQYAEDLGLPYIATAAELGLKYPYNQYVPEIVRALAKALEIRYGYNTRGVVSVRMTGDIFPTRCVDLNVLMSGRAGSRTPLPRVVQKLSGLKTSKEAKLAVYTGEGRTSVDVKCLDPFGQIRDTTCQIIEPNGRRYEEVEVNFPWRVLRIDVGGKLDGVLGVLSANGISPEAVPNAGPEHAYRAVCNVSKLPIISDAIQKLGGEITYNYTQRVCTRIIM